MWSAARRNLFRLYLLAGLGTAVTIVVAMVWAQLGFAGVEAPLAAMGRTEVLQAIWLSVWCASVAAILGLLVAVPCAYALARYRFRGHMLVDTLLDVPVVLSPIAIGMTLLLFFRTAPGEWIQSRLVQFVFEVPGIILAQFIIAAALQIRMLKATFEDINPRMEQVARYLGCGPWAMMWRVTLPIARPGLIAAFILSWGRAMGEYGATVTIAGSMRGKTETMPIGIALNWSAVRIENAIALVMILTAIAIAVLLAVRIAGSRQA